MITWVAIEHAQMHKMNLLLLLLITVGYHTLNRSISNKFTTGQDGVRTSCVTAAEVTWESQSCESNENEEEEDGSILDGSCESMIVIRELRLITVVSLSTLINLSMHTITCFWKARIYAHAHWSREVQQSWKLHKVIVLKCDCYWFVCLIRSSNCIATLKRRN